MVRPETREDFSAAKDLSPRAELLLRLKAGRNDEVDPENESGANELADLEESEKEARLLALHLQKLKNSGHEIWDDEVKKFPRRRVARHGGLAARAVGQGGDFCETI